MTYIVHAAFALSRLAIDRDLTSHWGVVALAQSVLLSGDIHSWYTVSGVPVDWWLLNGTPVQLAMLHQWASKTALINSHVHTKAV